MTEPAAPASLRIATYNIRALRDDAAAVVRVIRGLDADLVCVQEAPRFLFWRHRCRQLAAVSGLRVIGGGRAAAANLLLARPDVTVLASRAVMFSRHRHLSLRGAAVAEVSVRGIRLTVVGTHLDGVDGPRLQHISELEQLIASVVTDSTRFLIGVDVNAEPGSPSWDRLARLGTDAAAVTRTGDPMTNQPLNPTRRIDAIFVAPGLQVVSTRAVDSDDVKLASDHRPVIAELTTAS